MQRLSFQRGQVFHMTLIQRLPAIIAAGFLLCDAELEGVTLSGPGIAHPHLKERRKQTPVDVGLKGVVSDYVPFYFAPRSPMLYANYKGGVGGRPPSQDGIVYLVSTVERVAAAAPVVISNKHPLKRATFTTDFSRLDDGFIDWDVMFDPIFTARNNDTERPDRRQAELLAHHRVPLSALLGIAARTDEELATARAQVAEHTPGWHFATRPDWYFG